MSLTILGTKAIETTTFTQEVKAQVATLDGVAAFADHVDVQRLGGGSFTAAEEALIRQAYADHDAAAAIAARQARHAAVDQEVRTNAIRTLSLAQIDAFLDNQIDAITDLASAKIFLRRFAKTVTRYIRAREGG